MYSALTIREVLAHLTATASLNPIRRMAGVIRCRFDVDQQVAVRLGEAVVHGEDRDPQTG